MMERTQATDISNVKLPELAAWNLYFLAKLGFHFTGRLDFLPLENLALALFLVLPMSAPLLRIAKHSIGIVAAVYLLQLESNLPPISRLFAQLDQLLTFDAGYLFELTLRLIPQDTLLPLAVGLAIYLFVSRFLRISSFVLLTLLGITIANITPTEVDIPRPVAATSQMPRSAIPESTSLSGDASLNAYLENFFSKEQQRRVALPAVDPEQAAFDIIFLSVCSLGWDDLEAVNQQRHPLLQRFDMVFEQFNSATSYSGPAVLRLSHASCGQLPHSDLYQESPAECQLFSQLSERGYEHALLMNHDGRFDSFLERTRRYGHIQSELLPHTGAPQSQKAFNGDPIYRDRDVLTQWWQQRQLSGSERTMALYNTISLHDGNRLLSDSSLRDEASYRRRLNILFEDIGAFIDQLEKSGRNVVVVMIPEHGAALRGDAMQISGMREIPSPALTRVPTAVKLIGPDTRREGDTVYTDKPVSFLALASILARVFDEQLFSQASFAPGDWLSGMPETERVSQNEGSTVIQVKGQTYLSLDEKTWSEY
ncbi:cellulose biosynthesis protein BcsG [Spongiibacter tropicus]|uniref:cellulose biosynthesis protein BcsG n=1 Tax=Spongiibacter tropicus TaxID=454602 RepID=UPI0003B454ED|nr:cellulose biosynthesis protein BcsG [Spongiibacter tropicus]